MVVSSDHDRVVTVHNLRDYFRSSIEEVISRQGAGIDPDATHYVVNLLTLFSRSEEFYTDEADYAGLKPLALLLADASDAATVEARNQSLQRIGDVALFVSGFFADSLASKAVDIDYYIYMGENAYGSLSDGVRGTFRGNAFAHIFRELALKFQVLVDVLNDVRDEARRESDHNLVRAYEVWRKTGSRRARALLEQHGIVPFPGHHKPRRH